MFETAGGIPDSVGGITMLIQQISPAIMSFLTSIYYAHTTTILSQNATDQVLKSLKVTLVVLKTLRQLLLHGFKEYHTHEENKTLFTTLTSNLMKFMQFRSTAHESLHTPINSYILKIGKIYLGFYLLT